MPPRPGDKSFCLLVVRSCIACVQLMSKGERIPVPSHVRRTAHSVHATMEFEDGTVRMTSSHEFFRKQMRWSAHYVQDYWHGIVHSNNGVWPPEAPMTVRFCLSWLVGVDCTLWTSRQVHSWMHRKLGKDGSPLATIYMTWAYRPDLRQTNLCRRYVPIVVSAAENTDMRVPPPRTQMRLNIHSRGPIPTTVVRARVTDLPAMEELEKENSRFDV